MMTRRLTITVLTLLALARISYGQSTFVKYFISSEDFQFLEASAQLGENVFLITEFSEKESPDVFNFAIDRISSDGHLTEVTEINGYTAYHDRVSNVVGTDSALFMLGESPDGALLTDSIIFGILGPTGELDLSCGVDLGERVDIGPNIKYGGASYVLTRPAARFNTPILYKIQNCEIVDSIEDFHPEFDQTLVYCDIRVFDDTIYLLSFVERAAFTTNAIFKFDLDLNLVDKIFIDSIDFYNQFIGTRDKLRLLSQTNDEITLTTHIDIPFDPTNPALNTKPDQLVRMTKSGKVLTEHIFSGREVRKVSNLELHPEGGYLGCGVATVSFFQDGLQKSAFVGWIFRMDDNLNLLWSKYVGDSMNVLQNRPPIEFTEVYNTSDNGILALGTVELKGDSMPFINNPQIVAVKLDQNGSINGEMDSIYFVDFVVSSRDIGGLKPEQSPPVIIYPNPTKDVLYIEFKDGERHSGYIQLTNLNGQVLEQIEIQNEDQTTFDTSKYPPGMYVVTLLDEKLNVVLASRFIIQD